MYTHVVLYSLMHAQQHEEYPIVSKGYVIALKGLDLPIAQASLDHAIQAIDQQT